MRVTVKLDIKKTKEAARSARQHERARGDDRHPAVAPVKAKPKTMAEYLAALSNEKRAVLEKLRKTLRRLVPQSEECLSYGVPALRLNGRPLVAFGAAEHHFSFYPMSARTVRAFQGELRRYNTSKGTIRFQADHPLPVALVRKLIKARIRECQALRRVGDRKA